MKNIKNIKQLKLFDPWDHISPQKRAILDSSWPGLFQKIILPVLPASKLGSFYNDSYGRKSKELYAMLGTLVLQQQFDLTDVDAVGQYIFDERWSYALDRHEKSDNVEYMCLKTLWSARDIASRNELDADIFESVADKLAEVFKVDTDTQRLDSVHIKSNMRKMARVTICSKFIRFKGKKYFYLRYTEKDLRGSLRREYEKPDEFKERYRWRSGSEATFSELDRKTRIKKLRVRGYRAVRFAAMLKATGLNILRAAAVRKAGKRAFAAAATGNAYLNQLFSFILSVKEQVKPIFCRFKEKFSLYFHRSKSWPIIQADSRF